MDLKSLENCFKEQKKISKFEREFRNYLSLINNADPAEDQYKNMIEARKREL